MNNDITQHLTLELSRDTSKSSLSVKKNDTNSRRVQVTLVNNGGVVKLQNVVMAIVKAVKPDGTKIYNDCMINGDNIWFMVTSQMINVPGDVKCELEVTWKDSTLLTTPFFTIHVYDNITTGVESQNEYNGIIQALAETITNREWSEAAANGSRQSEIQSGNYATASNNSAIASAQSATNAADHERLTKEYRDYTKNYIDNFIEDQEENNRTLALANTYTNGKIADVNGNTGLATNLTTPVKTNIVAALNSTYSLAAQKNKALSMMDYETLVEEVNDLPRNTYNIGQSIYIAAINVPDLWIYGEIDVPTDPEDPDDPVEYVYTTDEAMVNEIKTNGFITIGYYKIAMLETQKVNLTPLEELVAALAERTMYPIGSIEESEEE